MSILFVPQRKHPAASAAPTGAPGVTQSPHAEAPPDEGRPPEDPLGIGPVDGLGASPAAVPTRPDADPDPGEEQVSARAPDIQVARGALGPLAAYADDRAVTDIFVNGDGTVWTDGDSGLTRMPDAGWNETAVRSLAVRLIALGGRHIDEATPSVDVRLADGIRVHAVLPPISTAGTVLSVRVPRRDRWSLDDLERSGMLTAGQHDALLSAIRQRRNVLITGAAGSGKTTLLGALLSRASPHERVVVIEDVAELRIEHPHVVCLQARQPNLEGAGEVGLAKLLREALRMRPDRLVLGECRGAEVRELLTALNTGHDGGAGTLHANSLVDVPARLEALGALAELSVDALARQAVSAIDLVLHITREDGARRLAEMGRFHLDDRDRLAVTAC